MQFYSFEILVSAFVECRSKGFLNMCWSAQINFKTIYRKSQFIISLNPMFVKIVTQIKIKRLLIKYLRKSTFMYFSFRQRFGHFFFTKKSSWKVISRAAWTPIKHIKVPKTEHKVEIYKGAFRYDWSFCSTVIFADESKLNFFF